MNNILNAREVAQQFFEGKVSYWTVLTMPKTGILPSFRNGKRFLFDRTALEDWKLNALVKPF